MNQPRVSVIIPVRNEGERLAAAIGSIIGGRSEEFPLEIVVVDDASSDHCCEGLSRFSSIAQKIQIQVVTLPQWSGIPFARNAGAAAAGSDILFITDANVLFPPGWDIPIRQHLGPNRVLCATIADMGSAFRGYGCSLQLRTMGIEWLRKPDMFRGFVPISPCTGTAISADLFRRVGGYDTAMPVYGAAEPEFSVRLWLYGAEIVSVPQLVLQHRFRPEAERQPFLKQIRILQLQNYLRFGMLYLDPPRVAQMMLHYSERMPGIFPEALRRVSQGDVWYRRRILEDRLPSRFESFATRFGLRDAAGNFAGSCNLRT